MSTPDVDLELELTRLVQRVRRRSIQIVSGLHRDLDYGTYLFFLAICDAPGQVRGADLAESMGVHKSTASRAIAALVKYGLVEQHPDPSDGRARLLVPTEEAAERLRGYRTETHERLVRLLDGWEVAEIDAFSGALRRFNDTAESF
ncbi:MarR family winged helix-turn-helix transcriptional regulator [Aeromicrobium alkaliterrae]|uniref:HTH marR-type domain-containing protein n=1 Tax=Aeromicrobium alkaliterrae TaxID=302168 RepID=A0ABN2JKT7_9ACTN